MAGSESTSCWRTSLYSADCPGVLDLADPLALAASGYVLGLLLANVDAAWSVRIGV